VFPVYAAAEVVRVSVMVVCTAMLAAWVPARNAIRINPAEAVKNMI
jgi:ABC-type lipoprotein release transport system permease subunit